MYSTTTRATTEPEQRIIEARSKPEYASYGCIVVLFGLLPASGLFGLGAWLGDFVSPAASIVGLTLGILTGLIWCAVSIVNFRRYEKPFRVRASADLEAGIVQEMSVRPRAVATISSLNGLEPVLAFDLGDDHILVLQGQWLWDGGIYDAEPVADDSYEEFFNGFPEPNSFPCSEFLISRFPVSGEVVRIQVAGAYTAPEEVCAELTSDHDFGMSELIAGSFQDIPSAIAKHNPSFNG